MNFSIIIPVLNEQEQIHSCLLSLQGLRQESEIIVVDGGSSDNTVKLAENLSDQVIFSKQGRARQMNAGADYSSGKMLVFLHADTQLPNQALSLINSGMTLWGRFDIQLKGKPMMLSIISALMNWRSRLTGIATGDQVIFISKNLFDQVGGYPEIALMEDIEISTILRKIMRPVCLTEKVKSSGRRWETNGIIKTIVSMWILRLRYFLGENTESLSKRYYGNNNK